MRFLLIIIFALNHLMAFPQNAVEVDSFEDKIIGATDFVYFVDSLNTVEVAEVINQTFKPTEKEAFHASDKEFTYWVKFKIKGNLLLENDWYLEALDPRHSFIQLFFYDNLVFNEAHNPSGLDFAFSKRNIKHKNYLFKFPSKVEEITVFAKIKSDKNSIILFKLATDESAISYALSEYFFLALFYGALFTLAFYNLIMYWRLNDLSYLFFVFYIFATILISFSEDGLGFQFIWSNSPNLNNAIIGLSPLLYLLTFVLFGTNYLKTKVSFPKLYTILLAITGMSVIFFVINWLQSEWTISNIYILSFLMFYFIVFLEAKEGDFAARSFFIAYSFVIFAIVVTVIKRSNIIDYNWNSIFWVYIMNIACFIEILLLTFAQTDKFRKEQLEKEHQILESEQRYKQSVELLKVKNVELQNYLDSNSELQSFAHSVSHDLKQPLRTITNFATLLDIKLKKIDAKDEKVDEFIGFIQQGVRNMDRLITDILSYSAAGILGNDNFNAVNINEVYLIVKHNLHRQIEESGAEIIVDELPDCVLAVRVKMIQLFQNLISNAIKFRSKERALIIEIKYESKDDFHVFSVIDNGLGIKEKDQAKVFNAFYRSHANAKVSGNGIGLASCHKIVQLHEGELSVTSEYGKGSKFTFTIAKEH